MPVSKIVLLGIGDDERRSHAWRELQDSWDELEVGYHFIVSFSSSPVAILLSLFTILWYICKMKWTTTLLLCYTCLQLYWLTVDYVCFCRWLYSRIMSSIEGMHRFSLPPSVSSIWSFSFPLLNYIVRKTLGQGRKVVDPLKVNVEGPQPLLGVTIGRYCVGLRKWIMW